MRKLWSVVLTPIFYVLLTALLGAAFVTPAEAKSRQKSSSGRKSGKAKVAKSKARSAHSQVAKKKQAKQSGQSRKTLARSKSASRGRSRSAVSDREAQALLRKRGKLSKSERQKLLSFRSSRRRRARAIYLARLRALRARDEALRNIAANYIQKDNSTGEDLEIRQAAVGALEGRSGTVVVMDPTNGRVYTIVNQQMALGSPVKPCSTVKMIVGMAALHEAVFDPNQDVQISSRASMSLTEAIARSNNPFFQVLGRSLGYERVLAYAQDFGFGAPTGVNYPGESAGYLPEEGEQETGHMSSHGDGFGVTAIQLAAFTSAIANGGSLYVPHAPRTPGEHTNFEPILKRRIVMTPEDRLRMLSGMIGAVNFGTAKLAYNPYGQVAGKTGTCTGSRDKLGLFTSFSSVDNPKLVVTVITTGSTEAGRRAAEIAGRIYSAISPRFFNNRGMAPATASIEINRR